MRHHIVYMVFRKRLTFTFAMCQRTPGRTRSGRRGALSVAEKYDHFALRAHLKSKVIAQQDIKRSSGS